jgi:hypothetical protein
MIAIITLTGGGRGLTQFSMHHTKPAIIAITTMSIRKLISRCTSEIAASNSISIHLPYFYPSYHPSSLVVLVEGVEVRVLVATLLHPLVLPSVVHLVVQVRHLDRAVVVVHLPSVPLLHLLLQLDH